MRKTVSSLISYIGCIGVALFVTFIVDGTIGMMLTYALIIALVVSLIMTLSVIRFIGVQSVLSHSAVSKGDRLFCEIRLTNTSFLPAPIIEVEIEPSAHFSLESESVLKGSVSGKGINTLKFPLTAIHSGKSSVKIKSVKLTDYLGIFSFRLKNAVGDEVLSAAVYPDIPPVSVQTNLIKTSAQFMANDDEEEESDESSSVPTGLAGYDHREYIAGDPIKRINWKASSKRDVLLVRLDEKIKGSGRTFLLDCPVTNEDEVSLTVRDNIIEGSLALLNSLLVEGRDAVFHFCKQGLWMTAEIRTDADVFILQEELADFEPCESVQVIPEELRGSSKSLICFTSAMNGNLASAEQIISQYPNTMTISSYASSLPVITSNQWVLSEGFELNKA
jgi:uncharacterized protein (DUF58 family)